MAGVRRHDPHRRDGRGRAGLRPLSSALEAEGFDDLGSGSLVESFSRHLMVAMDAWQEKGFGEIAKGYLARLASCRSRRAPRACGEWRSAVAPHDSCGAWSATHWRRRLRRRRRGSIPRPAGRSEVRRGRYSDCATTNDHHGGGLDRSMPSQYQAETSDQLPPRSSRITSQTVMLTP